MNKLKRSLVSYQKDINEIDYISQNIDFLFKAKNQRIHGILSPYSNTYESVLGPIETLTRNLAKLYGLRSLIVDISVGGDNSVKNKISTYGLDQNESGIYSNSEGDLNFLLLNDSLEKYHMSLMNDFICWKSIDESKKNYDLLFLLPSLNNPDCITKFKINTDVQWLFITKNNAPKIYRNLSSLNVYDAPFAGIVTV